MKKLLELLGTILVTSNAVGPLIVSKPNNNKIKNNLQTLNRQKRQIFSDLHFAIHENDLNKVKILLAQQIDVNIEDEHGWIPLLIAIKNNNLNIVQELLTNENSKDKININIKNKFSQTPLHLTAQENNTEIANLLLINNELRRNNGFAGFNRGFLNLSSKSNNNNPTNQDSSNGGNADAGNPRLSVVDRPGTSGTQKQNYSGGSGKIFVDDGSKIIGIENNYSKQDNKNIYDVSGDGSCLFWSVAIAYLLPVRNNNEEFKNRFIQLFDTLQLSYLSYMQNLLQQFDLTNHTSLQGLYQDATANNLVTDVFRKRVVDYIKDNLRKYRGEKKSNYFDAILGEPEMKSLKHLTSEQKVENYLQKMRDINKWAGDIEIEAITNILNVNIIRNDETFNPDEENANINENIKIFHVNGNHYKFGLSQNLSDVITQTKLAELPDNQPETKLTQNLTDIFVQNNLGKIADNSAQTILNRVAKLNPNLDINKINVIDIKDTTALIISSDENVYRGSIIIRFIIANAENNTQISQVYSGSGGKMIVDDRPRTIGTANNYNKQNKQNIYDVSSDDSCLFWSVAMAYLLPVRNNNEEFKKRFMKLFGTLQLSYLSYMQNLLQQFDLTNHSSIQGLYQDATANRLIRGVFRNRVVDYIERNLDQPTQINLDGSQSETFRRVINLSENHFVNTYLQRMRNINTWGGQIEILAIGNMLNVNINESNQNIFSTNNSNENIQIFHVESKEGSGVKNHYNFRLSQQYSINSNATNITADNKLKQNDNDLTITTLKPVPVDNFSNSTAITKAVDKYNTFLTETKQQKLNEINQHFQSLPEDEKKKF